ncbi:MFS transporter, partial [Pediococcus acidilactici]|nr:MFS transporter [Pediococcus acidilactici]
MGEHNPWAYTVIGVTFAIIFAIAVLITYKFTWERPVSEIQAANPAENGETEHQGILQSVWGAISSYFSTLKVKAFRQHMYIYLLGVTAQDLFSGAFVYFIVFGYGLSTSTASWLLSLGILGLPLTPVNYWLFTRLGARRCYIFYFTLVVGCLGMYYWMFLIDLSQGMTIALLGVLSAVYLFFKGGAYSIPWNVFPFIPDVDEIITSERREGEFAAMMNFIRKVTSGIASVILGWILASNGFKSGATVQTTQAIHAIEYTIVFGVGGLCLLEILLAFTIHF